ncbi:Gfo/Idh/MocA family oxidoreductase [Glycomyces sp. L485]|uniref:Gfo/Idh/MocA family protein n=1 Tax=Glycomyces sp. L485 TaxID=2909235 RepID=UPI001F4AF732|nr:Gfo/Idh/MocA family oxidoreductase [Glycomyces sp. L485]MCH7233097.1 Gfo/Idh/MocA family oxidoreductase [Glycomyces sp. L485]
MRIGIAGAGRIGSMHAENTSTLDEFDDILIYDPAPDRAARLAQAVGAEATEDLDHLLTADAVLICTPTDTHPELVRRAIKAKVPALCEKPLAPSLAEMRTLVPEIEASDVPVTVGFHRRFDPATVELHRRLRAGEVGRVYQVHAVCNDFEPPPGEFIATSGGLFRDCLIHDLDAIPWLLDEPVTEVYASGSVLVDEAFADIGDWDNVTATLRFPSGAQALLSASRHDPVGYDCRTILYGSKDTLAAGLDPRTPVNSLEPDGPRPASPYRGFQDRYRLAYLNELKAFAAIASGGAGNPSPAEASLRSLALAEACEQSVRSGLPVRLA